MAMSRGSWRMSRRDACLGSFVLLLVLRGGPCHAAILVPDDYPTIALGLQHAWVGDTVIVRCGTYTEHGMYLTSGVTLCSETGDPDCVVIDGDYSGSILISLNAAEPVRVEGISLTRGGGLTELAANGGGLHLLNCTAFIKSCNFDSNYAGSKGGAVYAEDATVWVEDCDFAANLGTSSDGGGEGGAIYARDSQVQVVQSRFADNVASYNLAGDGGAVHCNGSPLGVVNSSFVDNLSLTSGGAIYTNTSASITGSTFEGNGGYDGASIRADGPGVVEVAWCRFTRAVPSGALSEIVSSSTNVLNMTHCTIIGSESPIASVLVWAGAEDAIDNSLLQLAVGLAATDCAGAVPVFFCCDIYSPEGSAWVDCYADQLGVNGNISADPQFCGEAGSGNYYLQSDSPCAPANNSCGALIGALPVGCEAVATQETSISAIKSLY
jgi:predicted outer membrane repeat protein